MIKAMLENIKQFRIEPSIAAAYALSEIGDERAIKPLIQTLQIWPKTGYAGFMAALRDFGEPAKLGILDIIKGEDRELRQAAFLALASLLGTEKYKQDIELLIIDLENPLDYPEWAMGFHAAIKLGDLADKRTVNPLVNALKHKSSEMRYQAALALGKIGDKKVLPALKSLLNDHEISSHSRIPIAQAAQKAIKLIQDQRNGRES